MITRHLNYRKPACRDIWRDIGKDCSMWDGDISEICSKYCIWDLLQSYLTIAQPQRWVSSLNQPLLKQSFVFTDDCPATSVNWGWKVPEQRQYKRSKNMRLHCLSLKHKTKKLNQMNDRVREKEKAELLPYKGNIWEGKVSFSIHQEARAWSQGHSFHEHGAQHFRSPAARF